jgi:hypothetical protein
VDDLKWVGALLKDGGAAGVLLIVVAILLGWIKRELSAKHNATKEERDRLLAAFERNSENMKHIASSVDRWIDVTRDIEREVLRPLRRRRP